MDESSVGAEPTDLEAIYRRHGDRLWRALVLATGDPEVANDALAEAFAQVIRRGGEIRDPLAWVRKAAFAIAAGELARARRTSSPLPDELAEPVPDEFLDLWNALSTLTPHQRQAVVLADYAGWSHREIAAALVSTPSAIGVHVYRARRKLRTALEDRDGD